MNDTITKMPGNTLLMPIPKREVTLLTLIEDALARGDDLAKIDRLFDIRDREERHRALKAFDEAIAAAKAEIPVILKNRQVNFGAGKTAYKHADLAEIERTLREPLSKYGLSYRFRSTVVDGQVIITCMLAHKDGHREENSLPGPADTSGSKNPIQAIGSTTTYLSRYTLMLSLGLAASDDDDGTSLGGGKISNDEVIEVQRRITATSTNLDRFCKYFGINTLSDMPGNRLSEAYSMIDAKQNMIDAKAQKAKPHD